MKKIYTKKNRLFFCNLIKNIFLYKYFKFVLPTQLCTKIAYTKRRL